MQFEPTGEHASHGRCQGTASHEEMIAGRNSQKGFWCCGGRVQLLCVREGNDGVIRSMYDQQWTPPAGHHSKQIVAFEILEELDGERKAATVDGDGGFSRPFEILKIPGAQEPPNPAPHDSRSAQDRYRHGIRPTSGGQNRRGATH